MCNFLADCITSQIEFDRIIVEKTKVKLICNRKLRFALFINDFNVCISINRYPQIQTESE